MVRVCAVRVLVRVRVHVRVHVRVLVRVCARELYLLTSLFAGMQLIVTALLGGGPAKIWTAAAAVLSELVCVIFFIFFPKQFAPFRVFTSVLMRNYAIVYFINCLLLSKHHFMHAFGDSLMRKCLPLFTLFLSGGL